MDYTPVGGRRNRRWIWITAAALLVMAIGFGVGLTMGSDQTATPGTPAAAQQIPVAAGTHGPAVFTDGIPSGFARDELGAAAAAASFLQVFNSFGFHDRGKVTEIMVAGNGNASVHPSPTDPEGPIPGVSGQRTPVAVSVTHFTPDQATVSLWTFSATKTTDPNTFVYGWYTFTITLVWERGDWKAFDQAFIAGPDPADALNKSADVFILQGAITIFTR